MYVHAIDEIHAVLFGIHSGDKGADDLENYGQAMARVDQIAFMKGTGALFVTVLADEYPPPDAQQRRRFAEMRKSWRASPNLVIVMTRSAAVRNAITAVSWLSPQSERSRAIPCESFADVLVRAAEYRPTSVAPLQRLEQQLRSGKLTGRVG
jgi:hypothetical protein